MEMSKYKFSIIIDFDKIDDAEARRYAQESFNIFRNNLNINNEIKINTKLQRIYTNKEPVKLEL